MDDVVRGPRRGGNDIRLGTSESRIGGAFPLGIAREDKVYEGWKTWANEEILKMERMRDSAYTGIGTKNADDGSSDVDTFADADSMAAEDDTGAR